MAKKAPRTKNKDNARRSKKKTSVLVQESVDYIDYKDINLLRRFMSDRAKIRARRVTGNDAQQQREVARAIKNAREMALLPYTNRVTTQRTSRDRGPGGPGRADGPPPRPQGPPPSRDGEGGPEDGDTGLDELLGDVVLGDVVEEDLGDLDGEQTPQ
ncbi:MAG: small subunit ribosomal protein [Acidimicrobiaceae bacterium]